MLTQSREHGTRCGRVVHASEDVSPLMGREKSGDLRPPLAMQVHDLACRSCLNKKIKQFAVVLAIQRDVERDHLYAGGDLAGILHVGDDDLVSIDIVGDRHSAIVDAASTRVLRDRVVKVLAWYDNEWGYAARLVELASRLSP